MKRKMENAVPFSMGGMICGAIAAFAAAAQFRSGRQAEGWMLAVFGGAMLLLGTLLLYYAATEKKQAAGARRQSVPMRLKEPHAFIEESLAALRQEKPDLDSASEGERAACRAFDGMLESNANAPEGQEALRWLREQAFREIAEAGLGEGLSEEQKYLYVSRCAGLPLRPVLEAYSERSAALINDDWRKLYTTRFLNCAILSDLLGMAGSFGANYVLTDGQREGLDLDRYGRALAAKGARRRVRLVEELPGGVEDDSSRGRHVGRVRDVMAGKTYDLRIRYDHTEKGGSLEPDEVYYRVFWDEVTGA